VSVESGTMYCLSSYGLSDFRFGYGVYFVQFRSYARLSARYFICVIETLRIIIERYGCRYNVALDVSLYFFSIFFAIDVHFRKAYIFALCPNSIVIALWFSSFIKPRTFLFIRCTEKF